jgi:alpha-galactosidase
MRIAFGRVLFSLGIAGWLVLPCAAQTLQNQALSIAVNAADGSYVIQAAGGTKVLTAHVGASVDHRWLSSNQERCTSASSTFSDGLGAGHRVVVKCTAAQKPELSYGLDVYDDAPYAAIAVKVKNTTAREITVQAIRELEANSVSLGGDEANDRVLSDSFSEDRPDLKIYDLGKAPGGVHRAVGSQLMYNRQSGMSLFIGALTSERLLTMFHLNTKGNAISSYTIDSTGTTEIAKDFDLKNSPGDDAVELSLPLKPGEELAGERLMFSVGKDYHTQLLTYGDVIRKLHHARVNSETPIGWWSWTAYYGAINEGETLANADWEAQHLKELGYKYFHVDEGYQYARGEFTTTNSTQFPDGMRFVGHRIVADGLTLGLWTAPFEVTTQSWVYENHKDWLVKNAKGQPITVGDVWGQGIDRLYVLDTTNPAAQAYLRETYKTIAREWGVRFIKLDFMDTTAVEGFYHRPHTTALEAQRIGLQIIRDAVGDEVLLDKDGSPMLNAVGLVECGRVSVDTGHNFERKKDAEPGIAARFYMHRNFWLNDPDAFNVTDSYLMEEREPQPPVSLQQARASIALSAISGGMYEIGDDLLLLGSEKDRLALVENRDLLNMIKLGRAAFPVDLMNYAPEDEQPSIFLLKEDRRQSIVVVFNWTKQKRSRTLRVAELGLGDGTYDAIDVFDPEKKQTVANGVLPIEQEPESVTVIKLVNDEVQAQAPTLKAQVAQSAKAGETVRFSAEAEGVPAIGYRWEFGDGTSAEGREVTHAYTRAAEFAVKLVAEGIDGVAAERTFNVKVSGELEVMPQLKENRRFVEKTDRKK